MTISLQTSDATSAWLETFRQRQGRAPRVLHIGNIAGNGYLNAKILNAAGLDCDVICGDFYHIMGCPEWEDADFTGDLENDFYPAWDRVALHGFRRPDWFAQGPVISCLRYLRMRRQGRERGASWYRRCLERQGHLCCQLKRSEERGSTLRDYLPRLVLRGSLRLANLIERLSGSRPPDLPPDHWTENSLIAFMDHAAELAYQFRDLFPDREDRLSAADVIGYFGFLPYWRDLLRRYDVVVGYGLDGLYPLLSDVRPYIAFEHGTIRNIPFQPTAMGRLAALTYRLADQVFITNADNHQAAERLGISNYRFIPHPVNEDIVYAQDPAELRARLQQELDCNFLIFHPARQHWSSERHPDWEKGNDIFIHGFARFVRERNPRAGAVFVDWGQKVAESRQLLRDLGIADRVLWVPPLPFRRMIAYIRASDLVADQFYLGAFGSITPKAMMLGRPTMLYLDEERHRWCLPELPPVLNTRTPEHVCEQMTRLWREPELRADLGKASQLWYRLYHSNSVIAERFLAAIGRLISPREMEVATGTGESSRPAEESAHVL